MKQMKKWLKNRTETKDEIALARPKKKQNIIFFTFSKKLKQNETKNQNLKEKKKHLATLGRKRELFQISSQELYKKYIPQI